MFSSLKLRLKGKDSTLARDNAIFCNPTSDSTSTLILPEKKRSKKRHSRLPSCAFINNEQMKAEETMTINGTDSFNGTLRDEINSQYSENQDDATLFNAPYNQHCMGKNSFCLTTKVTDVVVEREDGSLGITLRGGCVSDNPRLSRPLTITQVRDNGPASRTGLIRVGDRLLQIDHQPLINKTLQEAQQILQGTNSTGTLSTLTIEYDISIMESVRYANGPLLVEIERQAEEDFGLVLTNIYDYGYGDVTGYFIEKIMPASTADRCGALNTGDQILAIDDVTLDNWGGNIVEAQSLLCRASKIQILPYHLLYNGSCHINYGIHGPGHTTSANTETGYGTINSYYSKSSHSNKRRSVKKLPGGSQLNKRNGTANCYSNSNASGMGTSHPEYLTITLVAEDSEGFGLSVTVEESTENDSADIVINKIFANSPAFRCCCLQVGDRIISVNDRTNLTLQEINSILEMGKKSNEYRKLTIQTEFDVADTITPTKGVFTVKLAKKGTTELGITITASKGQSNEPIVISEIKRGSIAHRTGILHAGDKLLAIDNRPLTNLSLESALDLLQTSNSEIVTLKIEKMETESYELSLDTITYVVELNRQGGPLGITISGNDESEDAVIISKLTDGGLARKTGALHIGDKILAINGESLRHRTLSDAIKLLQDAGDRVQLKISRILRNDTISDDQRCNYSSPAQISDDSAVHSWVSNNDNINENSTATPKDIDSVLSDPLSYQDQFQQNHNEQRRESCVRMYSDTEDFFCPSPPPNSNYNFINNSKLINCSQPSRRIPEAYSNDSMLDKEIYYVTLYKDSIYDDYGFSLSDGLYVKGVYVNKIRKGGPADIVGLLKPFDRIIQVNDTKTVDFDCCLTVPLIASAGDRLELVIARNPNINSYSDKDTQNGSKSSLSTGHDTITKML